MTEFSRRAQDIFESAVDLPADDREAYVEQVCDNDDDLKQWVLTLLKYADGDDDNEDHDQ